MHRERQVQAQAQAETVTLGEQELENVFEFVYLGHTFQADGDPHRAAVIRMGIARERFGKMLNVWESRVLQEAQKIALYERGVLSVLLYGCEAWILDDRLQRMLRGWNSRCLHRITGRGFREECVEPTMDIIAKVRGRRLKFLGHVLRREDSSLLKQVLLADGAEQLQVGQYAEGSVHLILYLETTAHKLKCTIVS